MLQLAQSALWNDQGFPALCQKKHILHERLSCIRAMGKRLLLVLILMKMATTASHCHLDIMLLISADEDLVI